MAIDDSDGQQNSTSWKQVWKQQTQQSSVCMHHTDFDLSSTIITSCYSAPFCQCHLVHMMSRRGPFIELAISDLVWQQIPIGISRWQLLLANSSIAIMGIGA